MRYPALVEPAGSRPDTRPAVAVAAIALAPLIALAVSFGRGLWLQGVVIVALLAVRLIPRAREALRELGAAPTAVRAGLILYAGAALWGAAVGLAAANPPSRVVAQAASMLLLPIGFLAFAVPPRLTSRALVSGLGAAAGLCFLAHLVALAAPAELGPPDGEAFRLVFRNEIGFGSLGVLVVVLGVAWLRAGGGLPAIAIAVIASILVVGGMSRGGWLAASAGLIVLFLLDGRRDWRWPLKVLAGVGAGAIAVVVLSTLAARAGHEIIVISRDDAAPTPSESGRPPDARVVPPPVRVTATGSGAVVEVVRDRPIHGNGLELDVTLRGDRQGAANLTVVLSGSYGALPQTPYAFEGGTRARRLHRFLRLPAGTERVSAHLAARSGTWTVEELRLWVLPGATARWLRAISWRLTSVAAAVASPSSDSTLAYRLQEWRAVRSQWSRASLGRLLAGQGLGALFAFPNSSWDDEGRRVVAPAASYIHNFYVFLGFKLGLAGVLALGGLLLVVGWTSSRALAARDRPGAGETWFLAAAASGWLSFLAWSLTSPQILDFRMAPIWGALLAASCEADRRLSAPRSSIV